MKLLFRSIKWLLLVVITVVILLFAYIGYVTNTFDTETLPENYGKVQSELFLSDSENNQQVLVVGLGGSDGGNSWAGVHGEKQRKLLNDNGYAFLSIAYFGLEGIPKSLDRIGLEGVHKAVMETAQNPKINSQCITVMGVSRGAELALLLGSHYDEYKSVLAVVPGSSVFPSLTEAMTTPGFALNGNSLPFVPVPWSATPALLTGDLRGAFEKMMENAEAMNAAAIQVENIKGSVLLMSGTTDEQWPSMEMSEMMMQRFKANNFQFPYEHIPLTGGHNEHHDNFDKIISFLNDNFRGQDKTSCLQ